MENKIVAWKEPLGRKEKPYAYRWVLNFGLFALRIHKWICSDDDRAMHDHPYWFFTLVLKGGYDDVTPKKHKFAGRETLRAGSIRFRRAKHIHTVQINKSPTWTLLFTGPPLRKWGFWVDGGKRWQKSSNYFKSRGHHQCDI